jgi:hypothetical protein
MSERQLVMAHLRQERELAEKHIVGTMGAIAKLTVVQAKSGQVDEWAILFGLRRDLEGSRRVLAAVERAMERYERQPENVPSFEVYA